MARAALKNIVESKTVAVFKKSYGLLSRARIQQLKSELQGLRKGTSSISDLLDHAKAIALALASAGKPVDDDDLVLCVLRGLGSEFENTVKRS